MAALLAVAAAAVVGCSGLDRAADDHQVADDQIEGLGPANPAPLESAAGRGDVERVQQLLDGGADPNDGVFVAPLVAAFDDGLSSSAEVARLLLDHGADVDNAGVSGSDQTPLHRAAMRDNLDVA